MPVCTFLSKLETIPDSGSRFILGQCIGQGVRATIYEANDTQNGNRKVAIKIQKFNMENDVYIQEEYRVLNDCCNHPNLPQFYGIFKNTKEEGDIDVWFAMELCEGGSVMDVVRSLHKKNRRMAEEHIAFILKETTKALVHLHSKNIIHRAVIGDNILLTRDGEIKLVDFGLSRELSDVLGKRYTCCGVAYWIAPEVVLARNGNEGYGSRADVWGLGVTAIELGDGKPPLFGMHPTRVMFQVVRNPPPELYRPGNWSEHYNDFISECLEKNPEYRPFMEELLEHPFLKAVPENCYYLTQELKKVKEDLCQEEKLSRPSELIVINNLLKSDQNLEPKQMFVEDLAAIESINEEKLLIEIEERFHLGLFHSFVGDVLLVLNPMEDRNLYDNKYHIQYTLKSRSSNPPHVYSIADRAYQDAIHQEIPQHVILSGESGSGKTTCLKHLTRHLLHLGRQSGSNKRGEFVEKALEIVLAFISAGTEVSKSSTRAILNVQIGFGPSGKVSTGRIDVKQLEKWRISSTDISHSNFHILYYFYNNMKSTGHLNQYLLDPDKNYRYLRIVEDSKENQIDKFDEIIEHLKYFSPTPNQLEVINKILAAILNLGEIRFNETEDNIAELENPEICSKVAELLEIDEKKFVWALTNYCLVEEGTAVRRNNSCNQSRDARDMLANCLYSRLVDWILNFLNIKMNQNRALYGEKYFVNILDYFGFESLKRNDLEQLLINAFNEQMQYLYIQRIFSWEILEEIEDEITPPSLSYFNNKRGIDQLLGKTTGILALIEEATKTGHNYLHVLDSIKKLNKPEYTNTIEDKKFFFSHYTGKVEYDIREMSQKNRNFLPPELIEVLRLSSNPIIRELFMNKLNKSGNLICDPIKETNKWTCALVADKTKKTSEMQYSQTKQMRTAISTFRSISLDVLRQLSVGAGSGGTHFVKCIRTNVTSKPQDFNHELIKQQLRASSVLDTARARQLGYPHRIPFPEFLKRYKFLAFDFDENVEVTKDNCRLLLVRLKMEGWTIGKSKVFLKYYNEEYLSRLYETKVKKIVKIQAMMRAFLARRNVALKLKNKSEAKLVRQQTQDLLITETAAALLIQKAYRGYNVRKKYGPLINKESGQLDSDTASFIKPFFKKWKSRSLFQVLLQYRSSKYQDLINLSQQIHIFNQNIMHELRQSNDVVDLIKIDPTAKMDGWLGIQKPSVRKLPFHFDEIPYFNTQHMCNKSAVPEDDDENWDSPLEWRRSIINEMKFNDYNKLLRPETPNAQQNNKNTINNQEEALEEPKISETTSIPDKTDSPKNKIGKIQTPTSQIIISPKKITNQTADKNFEGANQDFEFIPSKNISKLKRRPGNPIAELESIGRKSNEKNDDEPPFNFQGMLRKTNFRRDSLKKIPETIEELPYDKMLKSMKKIITSTELGPGMILEGIEVEL